MAPSPSLVAVVLVGFVPGRLAARPSTRALVMAVGAGTLIGIFLVIIDRAPSDSGLVPLALNRVTNATLLFGVVAVLAIVTRRRTRTRARADTRTSAPPPAPVDRGWRAGLVLALVGGAADAFANVLLLLGLREGDLSVMAVLTAMYPAGTIILAAVLLRERITPTQTLGLVLAITAAALLALV